MRKLKKEMSALIRERIPLTDQEVIEANPTELIGMAFAALEGIREQGNNAGKYVELCQYTVGLSRGDAWCMAAAQTALRFVELWTGKTSAIPAGGHCLTVLSTAPKENLVLPTDKPRMGDFIVYQHGNTSNGHVEAILGFYLTALAFTVGGNTSSGPGIQSEGDGVYFRMRSLRTPGGDMRIAGFLRPFPSSQSDLMPHDAV